ncbi:uncharacterized mitochondrial protein AtMg00240-like [Capsicum annuum]|uniref:uncharacterized mitochondrial protein AtMg00240-like n=1 Tax=Capsicum annuum TaxID=4072 RepID=UPI001FB195EF|nr:uncharacterized mitochondrial protein AtMg00240-like [Capsicum annuum]
MIAELGLTGSRPAYTSLEQNHNLTSMEYDKHCNEVEDSALGDVKSYQRLVGKLLYLTLATPDIAYSVQKLSQFIQHPKKSHLEAAYRAVRYIKNESGLGILLSSGGNVSLKAYCDANWISCPNSTKSV